MTGLAVLAVMFAQSLPDATLSRLLDREFAFGDTSFLLLNVADGALVASRWPNANDPIPLGSLVKPFTALAYGERHAYRYPRFICRGEKDHCWLPNGHGELNLNEAIAHSCNAWFQQLAERTQPPDVVSVLARFGVHAPPGETAPGTLIGRGSAWKFSPLEMARAYCELALRASDGAVKPILRGLRSSAAWGTASELHLPALAKTGTAPCSHANRSAGDGFVIVLFPPEQPRYELLVRVHGSTGAQAAAKAGRVLRTMQEVH